jgi:glycosyltransferase involved in cell wall biosynthesis
VTKTVVATGGLSSEPPRPRIFVVLEYFVPAFKAGGPLRSIWNLVVALGDQFEFYVFTRDRDEGDEEPFPNVRCDCWQDVGKAKVFYASPSQLSTRSVARAIATVAPDAVYLNSAFAPMSLRVLTLRKLGIITEPSIVAPRNELSPGALSLKRTKKRCFLEVARATRLYERVIWQCSTDEEAAQVRAVFPEAQTTIACDVATPVSAARYGPATPKEPGSARLVYLSRISPKKNLLTALQAVQTSSGTVTFDIYGPVQDDRYWSDCLAVIASMPPNIVVNYRGPLSPETVPERLASYQFFVLPTLGENFGHAIHEALSAGLPVLIGCETPWTAVTTMNAGWIVEPDVTAWRAAIDEAIMTNADDFRTMVGNARTVAEMCGGFTEAIRANARLLNAAVAGGMPATDQHAT